MKKLIVVLTVFYCALLLNINVQANVNGVISEEIIQSEQELLFQRLIKKVGTYNEYGKKPNKCIAKVTIKNQPAATKMILV
ncbi:hypothetical protein [Mycoplasma sp. P36-A1]|uniref:hypothetical protein n=1 Tax=Mycoplasma sp. P36-A1 TaxID=3252900 RepID=UPI003C2B7195